MVSQWVILAALGGIFSNAFDFFSRYILRRESDSTFWAWYFEALRLIIFTILVFFNFYIQLEIKTFFLLFIVGFTELLAVFLYMKMHKYLQLSISTILLRSRLIWIPLISFIFLGQNLDLSGYIGILLLFIGISVILIPKKLYFDKGARFALAAAFVLSINFIFIKQSTHYASLPLIIIADSLPAFIIFPIIMRNFKKRVIEGVKRNLVLKLTAVGLNAVSANFLLLALTIGDVSKVNAIHQAMMVTAILAGIVLLKEKENILNKLLGTIMTVVGVILLIRT